MRARALFTFAFLSIFLSTILFPQTLEWQQTNGPQGGSAFAIAINQNGKLFAIAGLRVYSSVDNGYNWNKMNLKVNSIPSSLTLNRDGNLFVNDGEYIYKSTDDGVTWIKVKVINSGTIQRIAIDSEQNLFAVNNNNVLYSNDNGQSWGSYLSVVPAATITAISVSNKSNFFVSTELGVFYSSDNGASWSNRSGNLPQVAFHSIITSPNGNVITGSSGKLFTSADKGLTWTQTFSAGNELFQNLIVDSSGILWASNGANLVKSTNNGLSWQLVKTFKYTNLLGMWTGNALAVTKQGDLYGACSKGILLLRKNETDYEILYRGLVAATTHDIICSKTGKVFVSGNYQIFSTNDAGNNWISTNSNSVSTDLAGSLIKDNSGNVYFGHSDGISFSADDGITWSSKLVAGLSKIKTMGFFSNGVQLAANEYQMARSTNNGATWQLIKSFPAGNGICKIIIARDQTAYYLIKDGLYKSFDHGLNWEKCNTQDSGNFVDFIITRKAYIVIALSNGLLISKNAGNSWYTKNTSGWDNMTTKLTEAVNGKIYAKNSSIVCSSDDECNNWIEEDRWEQRQFSIHGMNFDKKGYLYASTLSGEGVYRSVKSLLKILPPDIYGNPGDGKAIITFTKNSSPDFHSYRIYGSTQNYPVTLVGSTANGADDTTFVIEGLTNNIPYYVVVSTVDNQGNESFSDEICVVPVPLPSVPFLLSVNNEKINTPLDVTFKWTKSNYANLYHFQLSTDSTFSTTILNDSTLPDTIKSVAGLNNLKKYFWRVKAKGVSGVSNWSDVWSFTTIIKAPEVPVCVEPADLSVNLPLAQQLKWNSAGRAEKYHLQLSKFENFDTFELNDSTVADTFLSLNLNNNIKYYWRVRAKNIGGVSNWSTIWNFRTIIAVPDKPVLAYPSENAQNISPGCTLKWNKALRAESYSIQLSTNSGFTDILFSETALSDTFFNPAPLVYDTKYFWRVKAKNIGGETEWAAGEFKTVIASPQSPYLLEPLSNVINLPVNLNFKWKKVKSADAYNLQISGSADFTNIVINDSSITDTIKQITFDNNTTFYWRVRGKNDGGYGLWSEVRNFTTIVALPSSPEHVSPANNTKNNSVNLKFVWKDAENAASYTLQIATDSEFTNLVLTDSSLSTPSMGIEDLLTGIRYYWKVRSKNYAGISAYSEAWNFTTIMPSPEGLTAVSDKPGRVKLNWTDNTLNESGFVLERKAENEAGYRILDSLKTNITEYNDSMAVGGVVYKYRIKSFTEYAVSSYSNEAEVSVITSAENITEIPTEFMLMQNYPNPFNPSTSIEYSLPSESYVIIKIYNTVGEVIKENSDDIKAAGHYKLSFNAADLASGIYIYSISAVPRDGSKVFSSVRKMILMK